MITFIAVCHKETFDAYQFISCMMLQKDPNWKCIIYCDGKNEYIENSVSFFNDERIKYLYCDEPRGSWGTYNRIEALGMVETDFVVQTSIQDYYTPNAVLELNNTIRERKADFVYFNSLHNHYDHNILNCAPVKCKIDWGNFVIKTSIAQSVGIREPDSFTADGIFVEDCLRENPYIQICKIDKILTVHN